MNFAMPTSYKQAGGKLFDGNFNHAESICHYFYSSHGLDCPDFLIRLVQLQREIKTLKKKYTALTVGVNGENLSEIVESLVASNALTQQAAQQLERDVKELRKRQQANLNHMAIMHYNAFDFTYGELSFSMAVLDDLGNGYIFTNIHNRDDARCYCKRILNGESKHPLSDEEKRSAGICAE